jgi:hypothetical protein
MTQARLWCRREKREATFAGGLFFTGIGCNKARQLMSTRKSSR